MEKQRRWFGLSGPITEEVMLTNASTQKLNWNNGKKAFRGPRTINDIANSISGDNRLENWTYRGEHKQLHLHPLSVQDELERFKPSRKLDFPSIRRRIVNNGQGHKQRDFERIEAFHQRCGIYNYADGNEPYGARRTNLENLGSLDHHYKTHSTLTSYNGTHSSQHAKARPSNIQDALEARIIGEERFWENRFASNAYKSPESYPSQAQFNSHGSYSEQQVDEPLLPPDYQKPTEDYHSWHPITCESSPEPMDIDVVEHADLMMVENDDLMMVDPTEEPSEPVFLSILDLPPAAEPMILEVPDSSPKVITPTKSFRPISPPLEKPSNDEQNVFELPTMEVQERKDDDPEVPRLPSPATTPVRPPRISQPRPPAKPAGGGLTRWKGMTLGNGDTLRSIRKETSSKKSSRASTTSRPSTLTFSRSSKAHEALKDLVKKAPARQAGFIMPSPPVARFSHVLGESRVPSPSPPKSTRSSSPFIPAVNSSVMCTSGAWIRRPNGRAGASNGGNSGGSNSPNCKSGPSNGSSGVSVIRALGEMTEEERNKALLKLLEES
ncbi:hypothetical protein HDU67_007675 [Dinochytrium kinnereticum]|nr:hypothetical protein HDU67_007675 [Dinochytrium kinnereticum]